MHGSSEKIWIYNGECGRVWPEHCLSEGIETDKISHMQLALPNPYNGVDTGDNECSFPTFDQ